jgi:N utilization substance protein A
VIEPDDLASMGGLTSGQVESIIEQAEVKAEEAEHAAAAERQRQREQDRHREIPSSEPAGEEPGSGEAQEGTDLLAAVEELHTSVSEAPLDQQPADSAHATNGSTSDHEQTALEQENQRGD